MKKLLLLFMFIYVNLMFADGGIGYKGIYINKNGTKTWYKAHSPAWGYNGCGNYQFNGTSDFNGTNLGTYTTTDVLQISGFAVIGWTNNSDWVAGKLLYKIWKQGDAEPGTWSEISIGNYGNNSGATQVVCSSGNDRIVGYDNGTIGIQPGVVGTYNFKIQSLGRMQYNGGNFNTNDGSEVTATFSIVASSPILSATALDNNNIQNLSASIASNVTFDGGASVTERGIVYNTTGNPTTSDTKITNGTGIGSYTTSMTSLTAGTLYYVRSYAINSIGTNYGTQLTFTTLDNPTGAVAVAASISQLNLSWTKFTGNREGTSTPYNVIILKNTTNTFTDPTQGVLYNQGGTIGSATILYKGSASSISDTGLNPNTTYYYKIYSEGWNYYSSGTVFNAKTTSSSNNGAPTVLYTSLTNTTPSPTNLRFDLIDMGKFRQIQFQANETTADGVATWAYSQGIASNPSYTKCWRPTNADEKLEFNTLLLSSDPAGALYHVNVGVDGKLPAITSGNYYTFNVTEEINVSNRMKVMETTYEPVELVSVSAPSSFTGGITINTSAEPSPGEYVYARYSSDNWVTSKIIACNFTGTVGTINLPVCTESATTISYYFYSSNVSKAAIESEIVLNSYIGAAQDAVHDLSTLKILNNNGTNYSFTFGSETVTYTNGAWDGVLTDNNNLIIDDTYSGPGVKGCSCTINSGVDVTITSGVLAVQNELIVDGTLTFANNTSLIQVNDVDNTGEIIYNRTSPLTVDGSDYVYWSSPVAGTLVPAGQNYIWDLSIGTYGGWTSAAGSTMGEGKGIIMKGIGSNSFTGVPFNGDVSVPISRKGLVGLDDNWNLIGNPYPSAINAVEFITDPSNTSIEGTVALWTHGSPRSEANDSPFYQSFTSNYDPDDYIYYNALGTQSGPVGFNGNIAAGQAFFVQMVDGDGTASSSTVMFKNSMRTEAGEAFDNTQFYRNNNTNATFSTTDKHRIWLDIVNANLQSNRIVVGYTTNATNAKDRLFDATMSSTSSNMRLYSLIAADKMAIQGRALPFDIDDVVPLGYNAPTAGNYSIAIHAVDGLFATQNIYLEDTQLNVIHDIKQAPYQFAVATAGENNTRFKLRYTTSTLGNEDFDSTDNVFIATKNALKVFSTVEQIESISVFDLLGRNIFTKTNINTSEFTIPIEKVDAPLIVKVKLTNGVVVDRKVLF